MAAAAVVSACGSPQPPAQPPATASIPRALLSEARPIGTGPRFTLPASGPVAGRCQRSLGPRVGVHVEVFAANQVLLLPAGIGARRPRSELNGAVTGARCYGALVTLDPTGLVLVRSWCTAHARRSVPLVGRAAVPHPAHVVQRAGRNPGGGVRRRPPLERRAGRGPAHPACRARPRSRTARPAALLLRLPVRHVTPAGEKVADGRDKDARRVVRAEPAARSTVRRARGRRPSAALPARFPPSRGRVRRCADRWRRMRPRPDRRRRSPSLRRGRGGPAGGSGRRGVRGHRG